MSPIVIGLLGLLVFLILVFSGVPIVVSMMIAGVGGCCFLLRTVDNSLSMLISSVFGTFTSYTTAVVPMFLLMGEIATTTGIGDDLFDCFQVLNRHKKAGLAKASIVVCALFGAICGSTAATSSMMSKVAHPQMMRYKYTEKLSTGTIASAACLATLIPPSLHLITYGIAAEASIGQLLTGGCVVGILLAIIFLIVLTIWAKLEPSIAPDVSEKASFKERFKAMRSGGLIEVILVFGLSLGGMFAGWFTPTEAGAVGIFGMIIVSIFFKRFTFKRMGIALKNTMVTTGMIYVMLAAAKCFGNMFTYSTIPTAVANFVAGLDASRFLIMIVITMIYFILGCLIDGPSMILLTTPIFLPVVVALGYSPIWFGVYIVVICGLGNVTPPVGNACFVVSGVSGVDVGECFKGSIPYWVGYILCAIVLIIVPDIVTFLPNLMH